MILVKIIAHPHAHGVEWRRHVRESSDHDRDDIGVESGQILQELQAIIAGAEVPVEDSEIDRLLIGDFQGGFGVRRGENVAIKLGLGEPFTDRLANGGFVIDDQDGVLHISVVTQAPR